MNQQQSVSYAWSTLTETPSQRQSTSFQPPKADKTRQDKLHPSRHLGLIGRSSLQKFQALNDNSTTDTILSKKNSAALLHLRSEQSESNPAAVALPDAVAQAVN
jgi:hypothetical protein